MSSKFGALAPVPASKEAIERYGGVVRSRRGMSAASFASEAHRKVWLLILLGLALAFGLYLGWDLIKEVFGLGCKDNVRFSHRKVSNPHFRATIKQYRNYDAYGLGLPRWR